MQRLKVCNGPFLQCQAGLPPAVLGPNVLSKRVRTSPTATCFDPAYAQTIPYLSGFYQRPMAGKTAMGKLQLANMIKTTHEIIDKMDKREQQAATCRPKVEK